MRELFETLIRATSFGICNATARLITISAPIFAQSKQPLPMLIIIGFSSAAGGLSLLLKTLSTNEKKAPLKSENIEMEMNKMKEQGFESEGIQSTAS